MQYTGKKRNQLLAQGIENSDGHACR